MAMIEVRDCKTAEEVWANLKRVKANMAQLKAYAPPEPEPMPVIEKPAWAPPRDIIAEILAKAAKDHPLPPPEPTPDRTVSMDSILREVANYYNCRIIDIKSHRRTADIVRPRQVACYLAKTHTLLSLPKIGRLIGNRDHTTAMHAVRKITGLLDGGNAQLTQDIEALNGILVGDVPSASKFGIATP